MLNPTLTERAAEFWSDRQLQQFDDAADAKNDVMFKAGHELGMAEAEHDLVGFARKFVADPAETIDARCRRFLAEYIGHLDCCYGDLSTALAEAAGLFQGDEEA
ncbi:hypothetical protein WT15_27320 [Burkholderia stagnalis]|uniref:hypothetical protein n=1 Tax=Burkholderia stagnalis TaxID=1503054 RepID=UPI0007580415|nr:hypothetical protein [Burkholderia stagnalis]KVN72790.1 hypothetical protein WT15_27320 [Burkholderia stagnalis]KWO38170.1 hypothetical protein WT96_12685 [Burkholderia stagnalis]KWO41108.1 hypothetical protein WT95_03160 [Burkholderia stagnalis]